MEHPMSRVVLDQIRHYLYETPYCEICNNQSQEKNLEDLKSSIVGAIHILADINPSYAVIINTASGRLRE